MIGCKVSVKPTEQIAKIQNKPVADEVNQSRYNASKVVLLQIFQNNEMVFNDVQKLISLVGVAGLIQFVWVGVEIDVHRIQKDSKSWFVDLLLIHLYYFGKFFDLAAKQIKAGFGDNLLIFDKDQPLVELVN